MPLFRRENRDGEEIAVRYEPDEDMVREVTSVEWVMYRMSMEEFKRRLGITDPESVLTVITTSREVEITMSHG